MKKINFILWSLFICINTINAQTETPIMSFPFSGNTVDATGNSNNVINFGATLTADRFGNENSAYLFDGVDDYMQIVPTTDLSNTTDFAITLWFYHTGWDSPQNNNSERQYIFDAHSSSNTASNNDVLFKQGYGVTIDYNFSDNSEKLYLFDMYRDDAPFSYFDAYSPEIYFSNSWHFITYQKNGLQYELFLDGTLVSINPTDRAADPSNIVKNMMHNLYIGTFAGNNPMYYFNSYNFSGKIDDINIYDRALSKDKITELFNNSVIPSTPPTNCTITGIVQTHLGVCKHGRVLLFECENIGIEPKYSTALLEDGSYTFENIESGIYFLYVIPEDEYQDGFIPTYSGDQVTWTNTSLIVVNQQTMTFDIRLQNTTSEHRGSHNIRGNVTNAERISTSSQIKEEILETKDCVILLYQNDQIIAATYPDVNGDYVFSNLEVGTYELAFEFAGSVYKTETIQVLEEGIAFVTDSINVWPNPATDYINISQNEIITYIKMYDVTGKLIKTFDCESNVVTLNISDLKTGIYYLQVNENKFIKVSIK